MPTNTNFQQKIISFGLLLSYYTFISSVFILTNGLVFGGPISAKTVLILLTLSKQNCNAKISVTNLSFPKNASYCHDVRHCLDTPKHHEKLPKILGFGPF